MDGSKICMNTCCGAKTSVEWKQGWDLKSSPQFAHLCFTCGSAYENLVYCDKFHSDQTGWRECSLCNKRLHCGCSASLPFIEIQDFGGVWCITCAHNAVCHSDPTGDEISCDPGPQTSRTYATLPHLHFTTNLHSNIVSDTNNLFTPFMPPSSHPDSTNDSFLQQITPPHLNPSIPFSNLHPPPLHLQPTDDNKPIALHHQPHIPSLTITLHSSSDTSNFPLPFTNALQLEQGDKPSPLPFQTGQRPRHILPKPPKTNMPKLSDANKNPFPSIRVARPPAEGRLRNQLLPRYWPRITDQELQKLSGDLNSKITPLFEKVLSASDASRIGRLVLPKACAEAYFPPINQSEGLPLKIQDVKGNEWTFQFRFWPNNNSRMYVLEGVTPCIQSMQLQAGDTVTFSRIDPGGKLVIGYRKASNAVEMQDPQTSSMNANGDASGESFYSDATDGLYAASGLSGLQTIRGGNNNYVSALPELSNQVNGNSIWSKTEKLKGKVNENALQQPKLASDKKRMRNISSKSKRLLMHTEDAMELRLTWEETQDLLRPPPCVKPNIVMVEDFEFEEYSEPPVFGKKTFFTTQLSGVQEQWAQCDKCSKWRKLPADVLLPPKWICSENVWDPSRSSCLVPEETSSKELDIVFRVSKDLKKRRVAESPELGRGCQASGLDALATAATLGDQEEPSTGATTRHPRHRPGCTCIVCIQPPSGKGKHKPSCVCNVCLTVKRRFKTLMLRKKKRQHERELAEQKTPNHPIIGSQLMNLQNEASQGKILIEGDSSKGHIDLNFHPIRDEDTTLDSQANIGMMSPAKAQAATTASDAYMKPNGLVDICNRQTGSPLQQHLHEEECSALMMVKDQEPQETGFEGSREPAIN